MKEALTMARLWEPSMGGWSGNGQNSETPNRLRKSVSEVDHNGIRVYAIFTINIIAPTAHTTLSTTLT